MPRADTPSFRNTALLSGLPAKSLESLRDQASLIRVQAGEFLFHEGDSADSAFVVRSGRIAIVIDGSVIRTIRRGAVLGELALLSRGVRAASARAMRDCELWQLSRDDFERLIAEDRGFAISLCRELGAKLAEHRSPVVTQEPPRTIAIVPLEREIAAEPFADRLAGELSSMGATAVLGPLPAREGDEYAAIFDHAESSNRWVVLSAAADPADAWTRACVAEADRIIALSRGRPTPDWMRNPAALEECELLVVGSSAEEQLVRAIRPRTVQTLPDDAALPRCVSMIARRIGGRAVGLVLSGGGARALAHLGVIEELRAAGVRVDRVAGASMGAVVAATIASGMDGAAMYDRFRRYFVERNPSGDYTLPAYSLMRGRRTYRLLDEVFGTTRIEELPLRFYCVSADLNSRTAVIHRSGPVRDALFAGLSIPGVFPPVPTPDGRLLADGGILDNLPVETMAREAEGPVIAVDVTHVEPWRPRQADLRSWRAQARSLITGQPRELPRLPETMLRWLALGSSDTVAAARRHADIVITPTVDRAGLLDWQQLPRMREAGRAAVRRLLEADPEALKRCM